MQDGFPRGKVEPRLVRVEKQSSNIETPAAYVTRLRQSSDCDDTAGQELHAPDVYQQLRFDRGLGFSCLVRQPGYPLRGFTDNAILPRSGSS